MSETRERQRQLREVEEIEFLESQERRMFEDMVGLDGNNMCDGDVLDIVSDDDITEDAGYIFPCSTVSESFLSQPEPYIFDSP